MMRKTNETMVAENEVLHAQGELRATVDPAEGRQGEPKMRNTNETMVAVNELDVALLKTDDDPEGITPEFLDQLVAEGKAVKGTVQPGETLADAIMRTAAGMQS
jgi:hypothetical protein